MTECHFQHRIDSNFDFSINSSNRKQGGKNRFHPTQKSLLGRSKGVCIELLITLIRT
jgi:hypothetical protein